MTESSLEQCIQEYFSTSEDVLLVALYGSHATGTATQQSDIDIALYLRNPMTTDRKMEIISELGPLCQAELDVLDLHQASALLFRQVFTKGKILINKSSVAYEKLLTRLVYDEADFLPLVRRTLKERADRFIDGH
ncbi:MAG: nucleotidyltransferase domain-containing protein [Deltaproteobacteria bacterium]|nr:nucleotidyltransferase domain-containing protein [Deltaproteobacteria bacterium]MBN2672118.1 nucleotidyltransferase domain-containing protein [Deltaproteobacteria bacterium]